MVIPFCRMRNVGSEIQTAFAGLRQATIAPNAALIRAHTVSNLSITRVSARPARSIPERPATPSSSPCSRAPPASPRSHRCENDAPPARTWRRPRQRRRTGTARTCFKALAAFDPDLLNARDIGARISRQLDGANRPMQVHAAFVAQRRKARMHLRRDRTRMRAAGAILGPQPLFRKSFGGVFDDGQRIPDRDVAIDQRRHLARARETQNPLLVGVAGIERNEDLPRRRCRWLAAPATAASTKTNSSCCR